MTELQPLLDLLSSLLSAVLAGDLHATAAARELELARREADLDVLTGLLNRRGWDRYLQVEEERFRRFGDLACVLVIDLDRLKIVNDTRGTRRATATSSVRRKRSRRRSGRATCSPGSVGDEFGIVAVGPRRSRRTTWCCAPTGPCACPGSRAPSGSPRTASSPASPGAWAAADRAMYEQKRRRRARVGA